MGYLADTLAGIVATVIGRQIYDSGPRLSAWLVRKAARRLPVPADRERREEEWLAHLYDEPGLAGLYHAAGSLVASYRMLLPFETAVIRWTLWLFYHFIETMLLYSIMEPNAKRTKASIATASKAELEADMQFACKIMAYRIVFQVARSQLPYMEVDRAMLRSTLLTFLSDLKRIVTASRNRP